MSPTFSVSSGVSSCFFSATLIFEMFSSYDRVGDWRSTLRFGREAGPGPGLVAREVCLLFLLGELA